jgi:hypothetical protein
VILLSTFITVLEAYFGFIFSNKKKKYIKKTKESNFDHIYYGASVGLSRGFGSVIKIFIERSVGSFLPTLIVFEQLAAGIAGLYEKYLVSHLNIRKLIAYVKFFWAIISILIICDYYLIHLTGIQFNVVIAMMALLNILPISSMYNVIRENGLRKVAFISIAVSTISIILTLVNYFVFNIPNLFIGVYCLIPLTLFIIYTIVFKFKY